MANRIKEADLSKVNDPLEKFGMLGKEEGVTTVKELLWRYGNKCLGISPAGKNEKV